MKIIEYLLVFNLFCSCLMLKIPNTALTYLNRVKSSNVYSNIRVQATIPEVEVENSNINLKANYSYSSKLKLIIDYPISRIPSAFSSELDFKETLEFIVHNSLSCELSERQWQALFDIALGIKTFKNLPLLLINEMHRRNYVCNSVQMSSLLTLLTLEGNIDLSFDLFTEAIQIGLKPSVHHFSPLLKFCNTTMRAKQTLLLMDNHGIEPNEITISAVIKSCELSGDWKFALELLDFMRSMEIYPNQITYSCLITIMSQHAKGNIAYNLLREMQQSKIPIKDITYGSTLVACARSSMWENIDILLNEMKHNNITLTETVLISLIGAFRDEKYFKSGQKIPNYQKAIELFYKWIDEVENVSESGFTIIMDICESAGQYLEIIQIYKRMTERKIFGSRFSFGFLIRACAYISDSSIAIDFLKHFRQNEIAFSYMYEEIMLLTNHLKKYESSIYILLLGLNDKKVSSLISSKIKIKIYSRSFEYIYREDKFSHLLSKIKKSKKFQPTSIFEHFIFNLIECVRIEAERKSFVYSTDTFSKIQRFLIDVGESSILKQIKHYQHVN